MSFILPAISYLRANIKENDWMNGFNFYVRQITRVMVGLNSDGFCYSFLSFFLFKKVKGIWRNGMRMWMSLGLLFLPHLLSAWM